MLAPAYARVHRETVSCTGVRVRGMYKRAHGHALANSQHRTQQLESGHGVGFCFSCARTIAL